jgi:hypothetical protein
MDMGIGIFGALKSLPASEKMAEKAAGKALTQVKSGPLSDFLIFTRVAIESYGKWTSSSFYGQAVSLLAEDKSWTDASTFDSKNDCKTSLAKMNKAQTKIQSVASQKAKAARNRATTADAAAKSALEKQKKCRSKGLSCKLLMACREMRLCSRATYSR